MQDTIGRFRTDLEAELLQLRRELLTQTYTPGSYRETIITRPKRRMISAAPFRDRVVIFSCLPMTRRNLRNGGRPSSGDCWSTGCT